MHALLDPFFATTQQQHLHTIKIPVQPPMNATLAETWTQTFWPVTYNPSAPRATIAPPPQILNRVLDSIQPCAGRYLALAQQVAAEAAEINGTGRRVGAVVVDPSTDAVVAVAGDARYAAAHRRREGGQQAYNADLEGGGPESHAVMRVIDMVAARRRGYKDQELSNVEARFLYASGSYEVVGSSSSPGEKRKHSALQEEEEGGGRILPPSQGGGYLCTDLDLYVTHEPCLCCSMGLILSRFRAVVFPRCARMVTGGLASEPIVGERCRIYYGLHWRKELNWRALAFEFVNEDPSSSALNETFGRVDFHA